MKNNEAQEKEIIQPFKGIWLESEQHAVALAMLQEDVKELLLTWSRVLPQLDKLATRVLMDDPERAVQIEVRRMAGFSLTNKMAREINQERRKILAVMCQMQDALNSINFDNVTATED